MTEKATQQRIDSALKEEESLDHILTSQNQKIKEAIGTYKFWLAVELRKAHQQVAILTQERDLLVKQLLELRKVILRVKEILREINP
jgi:hypothetical protein